MFEFIKKLFSITDDDAYFEGSNLARAEAESIIRLKIRETEDKFNKGLISKKRMLAVIEALEDCIYDIQNLGVD